MRVLVSGTRIPSSAMQAFVWERLDKLLAGGRPVIIHGGANGVDYFAARWAQNNSCGVQAFHADWKRDGPAAGPIRNRRMLEEGKPDLVLAFHTDRTLGRGTADMVRQALAYGVPVRLHILERKP